MMELKQPSQLLPNPPGLNETRCDSHDLVAGGFYVLNSD